MRSEHSPIRLRRPCWSWLFWRRTLGYRRHCSRSVKVTLTFITKTASSVYTNCVQRSSPCICA